MIGYFCRPKSPLGRIATFPLSRQTDRGVSMIDHSHTSTTFEVSEWERATTTVREAGSGGGGCFILGEKLWTVRHCGIHKLIQIFFILCNLFGIIFFQHISSNAVF